MIDCMGSPTDTDQSQHHASDLPLTARDFPSFYNSLLGLRFPIDVAQVLELRFILNHAADMFVRRHTAIDDDRQFRDAVKAAIDSFGIKNDRHRDRLVGILTMIRDLHTAHLVNSKVAELKLRSALAEIRAARSQAIRHGLYSLIATIFAGLTWLGVGDPGWTIKLLTLGLAYMTWEAFHSIPALDREPEVLVPALNEVLRIRIESVNWKRLIHKLALLLGHKQILGVTVFPLDSHTTAAETSALYH
ncbi:MAG: hypothetical protein V3S36_02970 [Acidiferrobacterales bacterium]